MSPGAFSRTRLLPGGFICVIFPGMPGETRGRLAPLALREARIAEPVLEVLRTLGRAGYRSWVVGGAVRDLLLGRAREAAADVDIATPARPEQVSALFRKVIPTGAEHGTVTVIAGGAPIEVTTFRGEGAYLDGRRPSTVTFLADIDEDLARRDFTVNAIAYDPLSGELRDPFGGQDDLAGRLLRAVGDPAARFGEDGLRPLRGLRFVAQLGFALDGRTREAIAPSLSITAKVATERITAELSKLLVAPHARAALDLLAETGLLELTLPALAEFAPELRQHAFDVTALVAPELASRLAALLHPLAVGGTGGAAGEAARAILLALRLPGQVVALASALAGRHGCLLAPARPAPPEAPADVRRWLAAAGPDRAAALLALWRADARSLGPPARAEAELAKLDAFEARLAAVERERPPLSIAELALDGRAVMGLLGVTPGAAVGEALRHLLERVLDEPSLNTREALASELERWWRGRGAP